jgi:hypothetical protein
LATLREFGTGATAQGLTKGCLREPLIAYTAAGQWRLIENYLLLDGHHFMGNSVLTESENWLEFKV